MKTKIIFLLTTLVALNVKAVDKLATNVDNSKSIYNCYSKDSSFVLVEENNHAVVTDFEGADLYEGGVLQVKSKKQGFKSSQTVYQLAQGGELIISIQKNLGRSGDFFQITSARLIQNENIFYFSCN